MLHSKRIFGLLVLATSCGFALHTAGCGDDDATTGTPDGGPGLDANTGSDSATLDSSSPDAAPDAADAGPVFLDPADYSDLFTIEATFPFGVTQKHAADGSIAGGAKWGTTGPIVTSIETGVPKITTWTFPADPKGQATSSSKNGAVASGVPAGAFYGADGFVTLPFGPFALESYTAGGAPFAGEALLYAPAYDAVVSRAKTNGFYSGVGVTDGTTNAIVYAGLSPFAATQAATLDNGLYASPLCAGQLLPTGACAASHKLFGWAGSSGPVVTDGAGNVFVAAPLNAGGGEVYAVSRTQALATTAATPVTIATNETLAGIASAAALAPSGATSGWIVTMAYGDFMTGKLPDAAYAADYTSTTAAVAKGTSTFAAALKPKTDTVTGFALFDDQAGHLWIAVTTATAGTFFELQKKP